MSYTELMDKIPASIYALALIMSVLSILGAILLLPLLVLALPENYFTSETRVQPAAGRSAWAVFLLILKNVLGLILLIAGILMLVLPGQGLLTMLGGLLLLDFPGEDGLERFLARLRQIRKSLNWIRKKGHKDPFLFDQEP